MVRFSRKQQLWAVSFLVPLTVFGIWYYTRRPEPVALASYVPEAALAYLEINDWPDVLKQLTATKAWQELAPAYGVADKLPLLGKIGWLAQFTGGETALLARAQFALVVTGLEVRGEEVKPRLALLAETHSRAGSLRPVIEARLPEFARQALGQAVKETSEYNGVTITTYRAPQSERALLSAQIEGEWMLANHLDALRACIDARTGRIPTMANNFYLQNARASVERSGGLFGFVTGEGVARLLRFGAYLLASGALRDTSISAALQDVFADFAARSTNGIAYGASFENGMVVDRYTTLFKPDLVDSLKPLLKTNQGESLGLKLVPASAKDVTVVNLAQPNQTLAGIETVISARVGVGQSFLLHQFLLGVREILFGLKPDEAANAAMGDEIVSFTFSPESGDRVWLIAARDRALLLQAAARYLVSSGGQIQRETVNGVELLTVSDARRGAATFLGDYLALGGREQLLRLVQAQREGKQLPASPNFAAASKPKLRGAVLGFGTVKDETGAMMTTLARSWAGLPDTEAGIAALTQLPLAASVMTLTDQGLYVESHSPFGNFPFLVSLGAGLTGGSAAEAGNGR